MILLSWLLLVFAAFAISSRECGLAASAISRFRPRLKRISPAWNSRTVSYKLLITDTDAFLIELSCHNRQTFGGFVVESSNELQGSLRESPRCLRRADCFQGAAGHPSDDPRQHRRGGSGREPPS